VLKHISRHEGLVKDEDIRSIFLSAFINVSKGRNGRADNVQPGALRVRGCVRTEFGGTIAA
jgi:hypothetical protein